LKDKTHLMLADVFEWAHNMVTDDPDFSFSAIVGNPAYVSYQNINNFKSLTRRNVKMRMDYREYLLKTLKQIAREKGAEEDLADVLKNWSGLSDLSTYALLLAWLLTDEDGQIAFVMSNHWMERNYGARIRSFLASHGTIRAVITHREGKWFPRAEIPSSIFIFSKGSVSSRQKSKGIPYIHLASPYTSDIESYLESVLKTDFWDWVDDISKPGKYGPLYVSFRNWDQGIEHGADSIKNGNGLQMPSSFKRIAITSLNNIGWAVHQGLRTGCNEIFYLKKVGKRKYAASPTWHGKRIEIQFRIPKRLLLPTIHRLHHGEPLVVGKKQSDVFLLNFNKSLLGEDRNSLSDYPKKWLRIWGINRTQKIPDQLASFLREWADRPYEGKGKTSRPVTELSAVKTNIYKPLMQSENVPRRPRFWYQIPLKKRHFGEIIIPRVSDGPIRAFFIKDAGAIVIDANFSTFISDEIKTSPKRLWLWLNSNTFRIICELNGTVLGGGALKVESDLLSRIPVPQSVIETNGKQVNKLYHMLKEQRDTGDSIIEYGHKIDKTFFGNNIANSNVTLLKELIKKRS